MYCVLNISLPDKFLPILSLLPSSPPMNSLDISHLLYRYIHDFMYRNHKWEKICLPLWDWPHSLHMTISDPIPFPAPDITPFFLKLQLSSYSFYSWPPLLFHAHPAPLDLSHPLPQMHWPLRVLFPPLCLLLHNFSVPIFSSMKWWCYLRYKNKLEGGYILKKARK